MRIGVDLCSLVQRSGGAGALPRYTTEVAHAHGRLDFDVQLTLITNHLSNSQSDDPQLLDVALRRPPHRVPTPFRPRRRMDLVPFPMDALSLFCSDAREFRRMRGYS